LREKIRMAEKAGPAESLPMTEEQIRASQIGEATVLSGRVHIADYDPEWPKLYEREAGRIRSALGNRIVLLEHVGSTSVPGLAAKPRIDILLVVADSADEQEYVPALEAAGYRLTVREADWHQHRPLKGPDTDVNLHVFSTGCGEIERMIFFRDHLRGNEADRKLYETTKRELAAREWKYMQNYADAKTAVVEEILLRARNV
jgi:GrpB-like predicted nucleotidyltransferase (UPF0157 family)